MRHEKGTNTRTGDIQRNMQALSDNSRMFLDIYFRPEERVARDDVEAALEERLPPGCEVVGAGVGQTGSNIDLELPDRQPVAVVVEVLRSIGVRPDTILAFSDTRETIELGEF